MYKYSGGWLRVEPTAGVLAAKVPFDNRVPTRLIGVIGGVVLAHCGLVCDAVLNGAQSSTIAITYVLPPTIRCPSYWMTSSRY